MDEEILRQTLERLSRDTQQLLDWEAARLLRLRREAGIDMSGPDLDVPLCAGHEHDDDES